jgi:hypothetical protein
MRYAIRRCAATTIFGLAFAGSASAASLAPGQLARVVDYMGTLVDPGVSALSDPTLNGSIVSFVSRPLTIDVLHTPASPFLISKMIQPRELRASGMARPETRPVQGAQGWLAGRICD